MDVISRVAGSVVSHYWSHSSLGIKDFDIGPKIGAGASSEVYLCWRKGEDQTMAMKVVNKDKLFAKEDDLQISQGKQILREKDLMALQLAPSMRLFYAFQDDYSLYLVMEYCPGGPLFELIQEFGAMLEEDAKFYIAEILAAVTCLHQKNYLHRDIKPDNFLLDIEGHLRMADFGFARSIDTPPDDIVVGSLSYMAPEVVNSAEYSIQSDYYSIGACLFELLSGRAPYEDADEKEFFSGDFQFDSTFAKEYEQCIVLNRAKKSLPPISDDCAQFLHGLMATNPAERLGSNGLDDLVLHPFLAGVQWNTLNRLVPPFRPVVLDRLEVQIQVHADIAVRSKEAKLLEKRLLYERKAAKSDMLLLHQRLREIRRTAAAEPNLIRNYIGSLVHDSSTHDSMVADHRTHVSATDVGVRKRVHRSNSVGSDNFQKLKNYFSTTKLMKSNEKQMPIAEFRELLDKLNGEAQAEGNWEISVFCRMADGITARFKDTPPALLTDIDRGILADLYNTTKTYYSELYQDLISEKDYIKQVVPRVAVSTSETHDAIFGTPEEPHFSKKVRQYVPRFYYEFDE